MGRKRDDRRPAAKRTPDGRETVGRVLHGRPSDDREAVNQAPAQLPDPPRKNPAFLAIAALLVVVWMMAMVWMALTD